MSLTQYFQGLIDKVESSETIQNNGKDDNGFYKPTRTLALRHLQMLKDLHAKPGARDMVRVAWEFVVKTLPPEWLTLTNPQKEELKKILAGQ